MASGKHEFLRSESFSSIVNEVISSNHKENRRGNKLIEHLSIWQKILVGVNDRKISKNRKALKYGEIVQRIF
jgi:hypothetical protein